MAIEQTIRMNRLYDLYENLLTQRQREMLSLYYKEDFSLAEIAEHYDITRQGVRDHIKRGEEALEAYEASLQILSKNDQRLQVYQAMVADARLVGQIEDYLAQLEAIDMDY